MNAAAEKIRILLVDDHPVVLEGIRMFLSSYEHIEIVGEFSNGEDAIENVTPLLPDVVLMDIHLPGMTGLEAARRIRKIHPDVKVLMITAYEDKEYILQTVQAGAHGCVMKNASPEELITAIENIRQGKIAFGSRASDVLLNDFVDKATQQSDEEIAELSPREMEVLSLIAQGETNKKIASLLFVSIRTVEKHRENIMRKLDIHSAVGLARFAIEKGIVDLKKDPKGP